MKRTIYLLIATVFVSVIASCSGSSNSNKNDGWVTIFDGKSLKGWRGYLHEGVPAEWSVESDGVLKFDGKGSQENGGLDLLYDKKVKNFEFELEWKASERGNSGLFYYVQEVEGLPIFATAPEIQMAAVDGSGRISKTAAGSLYDMKAANPQNAKIPGEWNKTRIVVNNGHVTHFQNDVQVCEYTLWTDEWKDMLNSSKFSEERWPESYKILINLGGDNREGFIGLQDHGTNFWYRNIRLKELP